MIDLAETAATQLSGANQRAWLERLEREHDNMRAALDWATLEPEPTVATRLGFALWRFWQQRGYLNEARARFDAMAAMGWDLEPVMRARFAEAFGGIAYWQSDQATATYWYDVALAIWRGMGDKRELANALYNRAYADVILVMIGKDRRPEAMEAGRTMLAEALALYEEIGDIAGQGNILWGLGSFDYFSAQAGEAEQWYRRALELHRTSGHRTMEAWSLHMLALSAAAQSHFDEALEQGRHAMRHFYEAGDVSGVTLSLDDLSIGTLAAGERERAARLWGAARHLQQTTGTGIADFVGQNLDLYKIPTPPDVLPPDELAALAAEGAAMGLDEIVAYALDIDGVPPATHQEAAR